MSRTNRGSALDTRTKTLAGLSRGLRKAYIQHVATNASIEDPQTDSLCIEVHNVGRCMVPTTQTTRFLAKSHNDQERTIALTARMARVDQEVIMFIAAGTGWKIRARIDPALDVDSAILNGARRARRGRAILQERDIR